MHDLRSRRSFAGAKGLVRSSVVVLAILIGYASVSANEKARVLDDLKRYFGEPIDVELNLYDLSKSLVLQASFQDDRLVTLAIEPKSIFNDRYPDWKETRESPTISFAMHRECLKKFGLIKRLESSFLSLRS